MEAFNDLLLQHRVNNSIEDRYFNRITQFFDFFSTEDDADAGLGHGLFTLFASFPYLLSPDLLNKLRFNFKSFVYKEKPKTIPAVVVTDLLMSNLCREVMHNSYEMLDPIRRFLHSMLQNLEQNEKMSIPGLQLQDNLSMRLAEFVKYYAIQSSHKSYGFGQSALKGLQINAEIYLNPSKALEQLAKDLQASNTRPSQLHQLAIVTEQILGPLVMANPLEKTQANSSSVKPQLRLILKYAQTLNKLYIEGPTPEVKEAFEQLIEANKVVRTRGIDPILLPVPANVVNRTEDIGPKLPSEDSLALALIDKERQEKTGYLDLGNCELVPGRSDLEQIWQELGQLTHLKTLILSNQWYQNGVLTKSKNQGHPNRLEKIPEALLKLSELEKLIICGSEDARWGIKKLENLAGIFRLVSLDISHNQISKLEALSKLTELQELYVSSNHLKKIEGIKRLKHLRILFLQKQKIERIEDLGDLPKLEKLDLSFNPIQNIQALLPFLKRAENSFDFALYLTE